MSSHITNITQRYSSDNALECEFHLPIKGSQASFTTISKTLYIRLRSSDPKIRFSNFHVEDSSITETSTSIGKSVDGSIDLLVTTVGHSKSTDQSQSAVQYGMYVDDEGVYHELQLPLDAEIIPKDAKRMSKIFKLGFMVNEPLLNFISVIEFGHYTNNAFQLLYKNSHEFSPILPQRANQPLNVNLYLSLVAAEVANLKVLDMPSPRNLSDLYIEREIKPYVAPQYKSPDDGHKSQQLSTHSRKDDAATNLEDALRAHRHLTIIGELGTGKTTLLRHISLLISNGKLKGVATIPIYIELKQFLKSSQPDLLSYILAILKTKYTIVITESELIENLNQKSFVLLLDGADETLVGSTGSEASDSYAKVVDSINGFSIRFPNVRIVLSSRKYGWSDRFPKFYTYELCELTAQQIFEFIDNWFSLITDLDNQAARKLKRLISENSQIEDLASNPLLLVLVIVVFMQKLPMPTKRATLYERSVEILLDNWDYERNIQRFHSLSSAQKKKLLSHIALFFHRRGDIQFTRKLLISVIAEALKIEALNNIEPSVVLDEISSQNGLFQLVDAETYHFAHLSFQEYFAAYALAVMPDDARYNFVRGFRLHSSWHEVIQLLSGILEDASRLVTTILEPIGFANQAQGEVIITDFLFHDFLLLAARCVSSSSGIDTRLRLDVIGRIKSVLLDSPYQLDWEHSSKMLIAFDDSTLISELLDVVTNSLIEPIERRISIIESLRISRNPEIPKRILDLLAMDIEKSRSSKPMIKANLINILAYHEVGFAIADLMKIYREETNPSVKANIVKVLSVSGDTSLIPFLRQSLLDIAKSDEQIAWSLGLSLVEALWRLGDSDFVPNLLDLLLDKEVEPSIRCDIALAIGDLSDDITVSQIVELLSNESLDWQARWFLTEALDRVHTDVSKRLIASLEKVVDIRVKAGIATTLLSLGNEEGIPHIIKAISDGKLPSDLSINNFGSYGYLWSRLTRVFSERNHQEILPEIIKKFNDLVEKKDGEIQCVSSRNGGNSLEGIILASSPFKPQEVLKDILAIMRSPIHFDELGRHLVHLANQTSLPDLLQDLKLWHNNYLHYKDNPNTPPSIYEPYLRNMLNLVEALSKIECQDETVLNEFEEILVRLPQASVANSLINQLRSRTHYAIHGVSQRLGIRVSMMGENGANILHFRQD